MTKFDSIRKTRGDGNCFFRAFGYGLFEWINGNPEEIEKMEQTVTSRAADLVTLGYNSFTIDDFKDVVCNIYIY